MVMHALFAFVLLASTACSADRIARTEIMLVVDSDLEVPEELDEIEWVVEGPDGERKDATADLDDEPLPRSLGLVHTRGPLAPVIVEVHGRREGEVVLSRRASLAFVQGKTLVLPLHLARSCVDRDCGDRTCSERGCVEEEIDPTSLEPWTGDEPTLELPDEPGDEDGGAEPDACEVDAGPDPTTSEAGVTDAGTDARAGDAATCTPQTEQCNERDDDCDGEIDEDFDLNDDPRNCGECGNVCSGQARMCCDGDCRRGCF